MRTAVLAHEYTGTELTLMATADAEVPLDVSRLVPSLSTENLSGTGSSARHKVAAGRLHLQLFKGEPVVGHREVLRWPKAT